MAAGIRLVSVSARFRHRVRGEIAAVHDVSLDVQPGTLVTLLGPSGCGKTTTLRMIAGFQDPSGGAIFIGDRDVTHVEANERNIGFVFQNYALFPHLSVFENVAYGLRVQGGGAADIGRSVTDVLTLVGLAGYEQQMPHQLSGGEQQRVALGRSLIRRPRILLLDEPLTNLDAKLRHDMRAELKRLHRQFGMTIVYATPDELEALSMGEQIAVMRDGSVVQQGTPDELYETPADLYVASKIGSPHMNFINVSANPAATVLDTPFGPIEIPAAKIKVAPGERMIMGIRPADLRIAETKSSLASPSVQLLEPLGDVTIVSLASSGHSYRILLPEAKATDIKVGDALPVALDPSRIHLFRGHDGSAVR
jgi:multiple sugar transport system ATP-binding protein